MIDFFFFFPSQLASWSSQFCSDRQTINPALFSFLLQPVMVGPSGGFPIFPFLVAGYEMAFRCFFYILLCCMHHLFFFLCSYLSLLTYPLCFLLLSAYKAPVILFCFAKLGPYVSFFLFSSICFFPARSLGAMFSHLGYIYLPSEVFSNNG